MSPTILAALDNLRGTHRACPDCTDGQLYLTDAVVSEAYIPTFHVAGRDLPRRERACVVVACNGCEFTTEVKL
jgi:hypothetical protein